MRVVLVLDSRVDFLVFFFYLKFVENIKIYLGSAKLFLPSAHTNSAPGSCAVIFQKLFLFLKKNKQKTMSSRVWRVTTRDVDGLAFCIALCPVADLFFPLEISDPAEGGMRNGLKRFFSFFFCCMCCHLQIFTAGWWHFGLAAAARSRRRCRRRRRRCCHPW